MRHRTISGRIAYTSKKPEMLDRPRGQEWFSFTHHGDGSTIFRARCEIEEPAPTVLRDIVYALDSEGRPRDLHVHLTVGDAYMGSGWMHHSPGEQGGLIECESFGPSIGRLSQKMPYSGAIDGFGTHPIAGDGYTTRCMDISKGPHRRPIRVFLPSPDHRGATPPMIAEVGIGLEYVGDERVTVAAGSFDCRHFRFVDDEGPGMGGMPHPHYDMWVTADADSIFVQGGVGGYMQTWYELVELER
ncbi:hypothetical protein GCM10007897_04830 [Sphingobium jiangsuense]|uniref:DUF3108 domain-containing protein n=1 Tax=Sphingobium jiangsuense TaxID=870476 RepID=A0A7W6BK43_9SPHN|nr:hypothetical protein [Sphingobium jiangsuense]MBB3925150.1 hypothetical protein [Sphingobium jiangsuense]GLS99104.1 hypothetical protein GCM10007897_04830 [Sphingobium jiangsuense]